MDTNGIGPASDSVVNPVAPPQVPDKPREAEAPAESAPAEPPADSGKILDLYV